MNKSYFTIPIILAILATVLLPLNALADEPIISNWAMPAVEAMWQNELADESMFKDYHKNIARDEFVLLAVRFYEMVNDTTLKEESTMPFNDISGSRYKKEIAQAYKLGIVCGVGNGKFNPSGEITRQEVMVMLFRILKALYPEKKFNVSGNMFFNDSKEISPWAKEAVTYMYENATGIQTESALPLLKVTRETAFTMVYKVGIDRNLIVGSEPLIFPASQLRKFQPKQNHIKLQEEQVDILGDSNKEDILLYAKQGSNEVPLMCSLVVNGYEKLRLGSGEYNHMKLKLEDLEGDGKAEILLFRASSGSAGAQSLYVVDSVGDELKTIMASIDMGYSDNSRFIVKYKGNYTVSFSDNQIGMTADIPLHREYYKGIENMLERISTWIDPVANFQIKDSETKGIKDIVAEQRVIGIAHADTLAILKMTYKFIGDWYRPVNLSLYDADDKLITGVDFGNK